MQFDCARCETVHAVDESEAEAFAQFFVESIDEGGAEFGRGLLPDLPLSASELFAPGGGKMFACLVAEDDRGEQHVRFAFSGMLARKWSWPGWAPPCFDVARWRALEQRYDPEIAALTARIVAGEERKPLERERAQRSRELMARYHGLYRIAGPGGGVHSLEEIVGPGKMVSGMGDCCAPKLLNDAHSQGWRPRSMVEFFVGTSRRPGVRVHGQVYPPCEEKCGPLLSYLTCPQWSGPAQ